MNVNIGNSCQSSETKWRVPTTKHFRNENMMIWKCLSIDGPPVSCPPCQYSFDLWPWPSNSSEILSRSTPPSNVGSLCQTVQPGERWQTHRHTDTHIQMGPIPCPRPLSQEGKLSRPPDRSAGLCRHGIFIDREATEINVLGSIRPSVCPSVRLSLTAELFDLWPWYLVCRSTLTLARLGL